MGLFESKEEKAVRRQMAIRMGKKKVGQYVIDCQRMSGKYADMAKKALALGDSGQCDQYLLRRIQYDKQSNKWSSFLLRMEDLSMRGQMSGAMTGLIQGMQSLTKEISAGVSEKEMAKVVADLNVTMARLEQTEEQLTMAMDGLDYAVGTTDDQPMMENAIPAELRDEVARMRAEMMDEVVVREKVGDGVGRTAGVGQSASVDSRIKGGLDRIRELKKKP